MAYNRFNCCCNRCKVCEDIFDRDDTGVGDPLGGCGYDPQSGSWRILNAKLRSTGAGILAKDTPLAVTRPYFEVHANDLQQGDRIKLQLRSDVSATFEATVIAGSQNLMTCILLGPEGTEYYSVFAPWGSGVRTILCVGIYRTVVSGQPGAFTDATAVWGDFGTTFILASGDPLLHAGIAGTISVRKSAYAKYGFDDNDFTPKIQTYQATAISKVLLGSTAGDIPDDISGAITRGTYPNCIMPYYTCGTLFGFQDDPPANMFLETGELAIVSGVWSSASGGYSSSGDGVALRIDAQYNTLGQAEHFRAITLDPFTYGGFPTPTKPLDASLFIVSSGVTYRFRHLIEDASPHIHLTTFAYVDGNQVLKYEWPNGVGPFTDFSYCYGQGFISFPGVSVPASTFVTVTSVTLQIDSNPGTERLIFYRAGSTGIINPDIGIDELIGQTYCRACSGEATCGNLSNEMELNIAGNIYALERYEGFDGSFGPVDPGGLLNQFHIEDDYVCTANVPTLEVGGIVDYARDFSVKLVLTVEKQAITATASVQNVTLQIFLAPNLTYLPANSYTKGWSAVLTGSKTLTGDIENRWQCCESMFPMELTVDVINPISAFHTQTPSELECYGLEVGDTVTVDMI